MKQIKVNNPKLNESNSNKVVFNDDFVCDFSNKGTASEKDYLNLGIQSTKTPNIKLCLPKNYKSKFTKKPKQIKP
ncbi:MAG: hypothetical protein A2252_05870 [Elusimicrobia bacterium RIFOXYA2_FULL_39_19]|nr:MAG: hypothetical protein A2252_05870 [Elusimicrobia bacterium RIFOXYA2_FULL_39_19]